MPKSLFVDPKETLASGKISFNDIPVNAYNKTIKEERSRGTGIWEINIFGKTVEQLMKEGIQNKISAIGEESQKNLQDTMQKILNESNGGMIFIII